VTVAVIRTSGLTRSSQFNGKCAYFYFYNAYFSSPNSMFDHLLESYHRDHSNKWSNMEFCKKRMQVVSVEVTFTQLIWSYVPFLKLQKIRAFVDRIYLGQTVVKGLFVYPRTMLLYVLLNLFPLKGEEVVI